MIRIFKYNVKNPEATEKLVNAYQKIFNHPDNMKYLTYTGLPIKKAQIKSWVKTHIEDGIDYYTWSNSTGEIKGIGLSSTNSVQGFEILGCAVANDAQNHKVGSKILKRLCNDAKEKGFKTASIKVFADNKKMLRLVIGQDFIPSKIKHRMRFDGCDLVILTKYL